MRKKSTTDQILDNQVSEKKGADPWYFRSVALPLFNGEERSGGEYDAERQRKEGSGVRYRENQPGKSQRKPVPHTTFARLFLAPMVLPHKRGDTEVPLGERQHAFLEQYRKAVEKYPSAMEQIRQDMQKTEQGKAAQLPDTLGRRAHNMVNFFEKEKEVSALADNQKSGYSKKTDAYTNPKRYLSFYEDENADIQLAERLYTRELEILFDKNRASLANRLRYLLSAMPENGAFLLGNRQPTDELLLTLSGRILQTALLLAAADRLQDGEVYQLLKKKFGIPMPVNVAIAGKRARQRVNLPLYAVEQLCSTLCAEGLSQAAARALLPLVQAMPAAQRAENLEIMIQEMERQMGELDGRVYSEQDREKKRLLRAKAQELDNLIGELCEQKEQTERVLADFSADS